MKWLTQWAITSSALILIILAARYLLREKLSARWRYALWAVVLVRLLVPFQVELPAQAAGSLPLLASNLAPEIGEERSVPVFPENSQPVSRFDFAIEDLLKPGEVMPTETSMGYYQRSQDGETIIRYMDLWSPAQIVGTIWGTGAFLMTLVLLVSNLRFAHRLEKRRRRLEGMEAPIPVYIAEGLPSPCLFGVFRPAVYVTPRAAENPDTLRHVLAHELTHYAHKDHIWSLLRCLALALHWYNPLVWLAVGLSKRDGELACDEGTVARLGEAERIPYGRTLVDIVAQRSRPAGLLSCSTAMTGGKKSIQQRVARLVKKPETVKTALFAAIAVVAVAVVFVFAQWGQPDNMNVIFIKNLDRATAISYCPSYYSSSHYPYPITDEDLLAEAKQALSGFTCLGPDGPQPDLSKAHNQSHIVLSFPGGETTYTLWSQKGYTYLFEYDIWQECLDFQRENGENFQLERGNSTCILHSNRLTYFLGGLARQQAELARDPSLPRPMSQEELNQYNEKFLRKIGVTQLWGRPDSMESVVFHAGSTSPDSIELWYWGDDTHDGVWVLALEQESYTLLADQPIEVFNAAQNAGEWEELLENQRVTLPRLYSALEDCEWIRFQDSSIPDITDPVCLDWARRFLISDRSLLISDLSQTGQDGDNETIIIRGKDGQSLSSFLITNQGIRQYLHRIALNQQAQSLLGELSFDGLAPGEERAGEYTVAVPPSGDVQAALTYDRPVLTLEFGLRAEDGTEYCQEVIGGVSRHVFSDIPAGIYQIFIRNIGDYTQFPTYWDGSASYGATGAILFLKDD